VKMNRLEIQKNMAIPRDFYSFSLDSNRNLKNDIFKIFFTVYLIT